MIGELTCNFGQGFDFPLGPGKFECLGQGRSVWCRKAELSVTLIQNTKEAPMGPRYYIGLDVHRRRISYCVKEGSGKIHAEGSISGYPCGPGSLAENLTQSIF